MPIQEKLHGIVVPMVTPFDDSVRLDVAGLERLVEHLIAGGVQGIFPLGTTGEAYSLASAVRIEVIQRTCRLVGGRVPVLVGVSETSWPETRAMADAAAQAGAAAVVVAPPCYYPLDQQELLRYLEMAIEALPLPTLLYNIPQMTKTAIAPETVSRLMQNSRVLGIKDSSGNFEYLVQLLELRSLRDDWSVLLGNELLLAKGLMRGAHGAVSGGSNLNPRLYASLCRAAAVGDAEQLQRCQQMVARQNELYRLIPSSVGGIRAIKTALSIRGICGDQMAPPFVAHTDHERAQIARLLDELQADTL